MRSAPLLIALSVAIGLATWTAAPSADPVEPSAREHIDFWQRNFTELTPEGDPRVARARDIFARLTRIAGRRPGIEPRLYVIREESAAPMPIAIPDGWIILSKRVIDFCYRNPKHGDDRLAFVLAHEISHLLEDDFWHMKFFQAIDAYQPRSRDQQLLDQVRQIAAQTDKVLAKELRADELGITYVAMAGFDARAVIDDGKNENFFSEWVAAFDPARAASPASPTHPQPLQRATTVKARLRQVLDHADLFDLGVLFYEAGDYARAITAFNEFLRYFPGREVHHNLGAAHHQLALQMRRPLANERRRPLYKISVTIDPLSRAHGIRRGPPANAARDFERHIAAAIDQYQIALNQDPSYLPVYLGLGGAYLANGETYKAIAVLLDGLKLAPRDAVVLNSLGVAFAYAQNTAEARRYLESAHKTDPTYDAPLFNLAMLLRQQSDANEAARYAKMYLERDAGSDWARLLHERFALNATARVSVEPESLAGLEVGAYNDEVPATWGAPATRSFQLEPAPTRLARYPNGIVTVSLGDEIRLLAATRSYPGKTRAGIGIGQTRQDVEARYGPPTEVLPISGGENLVYASRGVTFSLQAGRVASWLLYWD